MCPPQCWRPCLYPVAMLLPCTRVVRPDGSLRCGELRRVSAGVWLLRMAIASCTGEGGTCSVCCLSLTHRAVPSCAGIIMNLPHELAAVSWTFSAGETHPRKGAWAEGQPSLGGNPPAELGVLSGSWLGAGDGGWDRDVCVWGGWRRSPRMHSEAGEGGHAGRLWS